jgi:hypothetical protein
MSKKCIACPRGRSISVDEPGVPPLCRSCWDRAGQRIRVGSRVVATEDDTSRGTVRKIVDGNIAVIECDDGGEAWIPTPLLVAVKR